MKTHETPLKTQESRGKQSISFPKEDPSWFFICEVKPMMDHFGVCTSASKVPWQESEWGVGMGDFQESRAVRIRTQDHKEVATPEEKADWAAAARAFVEAGGSAQPTPAKLHRLAAHDWLVALDSGMKAATGKGLSAFLPVHAEAPEGSSAAVALELRAQASRGVPLLSVSCDQGSDGFSAGQYLLYERALHMVLLMDPSHRVWNDCRVALQRTPGLHAALLKSTLVFNLNMGPFESAAWYQQAKEAMQLYVVHAKGQEDPLWQSLLPHILKDLGAESRVVEPDFLQELWDTLGECGATELKGTKVSLTRWFNWVDAAEAWSPSSLYSPPLVLRHLPQPIH